MRLNKSLVLLCVGLFGGLAILALVVVAYALGNRLVVAGTYASFDHASGQSTAESVGYVERILGHRFEQPSQSVFVCAETSAPYEFQCYIRVEIRRDEFDKIVANAKWTSETQLDGELSQGAKWYDATHSCARGWWTPPLDAHPVYGHWLGEFGWEFIGYRWDGYIYYNARVQKW